MQDVRLALRHLRRSPGFSLTVILTIALGIGANTAIFTLVHAVLLKSLPVGEPKSLYRIGDREGCCVTNNFERDDGNFTFFSYDLYRRFRDAAPEFEQLAAMEASQGSLMSVRRGRAASTSEHTEYVSATTSAHLAWAASPAAF